MLKSLTVWNFALLKQVQVEFGDGLNILTGETGAGKSILIDALGAILGRRISSDAIRTGCDSLRVEAVFTLEDESEALKSFLDEQAIEPEDGTLIITRQILRTGRNNNLVNGCHVTLTLLKQLGAHLVDVYGQHDSLSLLKEDSQFRLVDESSADVQDALDVYQQAYRAWQQAKKDFDEKQQDSREYAQRLDMLRWQAQEIRAAQIQPHEDETLEAEIRKLSHAEKIASYISESHDIFEGGGKTGEGILTGLSRIRKNLEELSRYDDTLANAQKIIEDASISLQEASYEVRDYAENIEFNPARLDQLQSRADVLYRLGKKYGGSSDDVLAYLEKIDAELRAIENYDADIAELEKKLQEREEDVRGKANLLTRARKKAAKQLDKAVGEQITALGMPKAVFTIDVSPAERYQLRGADTIALLFSANPGETPKPLQKVASGGELSRIALAIKTVDSARDTAAASMVFDEIDTGIGGRTAQMVAERIAQVAVRRQVLCITHLPQIACMADTHLYIAKTVEGGTAMTHVQPLSEHERIQEIARMASGADLTTAALGNAKEMISHARVKKQKLAKL